MAWESQFDNTKWIAISGASWTGSSWSIELTGGTFQSQLETIGTWSDAYRPSSVRLSMSTNNMFFNIIQQGGTVLASASPAISGTAYPITFFTSAPSGDIYRLILGESPSPSAV